MAVRMTHPNLPGAEISVAASAVPFHEDSGWKQVPGQAERGEVWPAELRLYGGQPLVRLYHPDLDAEVTVAESAVPFHRERGWQVVDVDDPGPETPAEDAAEGDGLDAKTVAELQALARDRGLPVSGTKAELLERLREHEQQQDVQQDAGEPAQHEGDEQ
jgi:hypothetical protein